MQKLKQAGDFAGFYGDYKIHRAPLFLPLPVAGLLSFASRYAPRASNRPGRRLAFCLPVEHFVQVFVPDLEYDVMGRHRLGFEESRQPVLLCSESRPFVEVSFHLEYGFAEFSHAVGVEVQTIEGIEQVEKGLERVRLIEHCEGDEKAHAR